MSRKIEHDHLIITDSNQVSFAKMSPAERKKFSFFPDPADQKNHGEAFTYLSSTVESCETR
jgi:hypothetical protein